jgi:hypothetical protein
MNNLDWTSFFPLLTRKQVQVFFRIGHTKADQLIQSGELESFKDGASRRVTRESCFARLERLKAMPKPTTKGRSGAKSRKGR